MITGLMRLYAQENAGGILRRSVRKLLHAMFETNNAFWFERSLTGDMPRVTPRIPVTIQYGANWRTIRWIRSHGEPWMYNRRELVTGMSAGHHFMNVRHDGEIVGYAKVAVRRVYVHDYRSVLTLPDGYAFIYDTYVLPGYRGLRIASTLVAGVMQFLAGQGYRRLGCHIPPWNIASINTYRSLGFEPTRYVRYMRIAGIRIFTNDPGIAVTTA